MYPNCISWLNSRISRISNYFLLSSVKILWAKHVVHKISIKPKHLNSSKRHILVSLIFQLLEDIDPIMRIAFIHPDLGIGEYTHRF